METTYNGWKNYVTWNVALWMQNDPGFYAAAEEATEFDEFCEFVISNGHITTPDGVEWDDETVDYKALNSLVSTIGYGTK